MTPISNKKRSGRKTINKLQEAVLNIDSFDEVFNNGLIETEDDYVK
jgi:hypothetical protein